MSEKFPKKIERSRKVAEIIFEHPDFNYSDIYALTEKESEEKFNRRAEEIFSKIEIAVHGMGKNKETGKEKQRGDLDGEAALGLLRLANLKVRSIEYVGKGDIVPGKMHIDTGGKNGIVIEKEKNGMVTIYIDHHSSEFSLEPTSATQLLYEGLTAAGKLKEEPYLDRLVEFVTQADNLSYPSSYYEKYPDYDKMLVGLWGHMQFAHLEQFFKDGKSPTDILTPQEIKKYNLEKTSEAQKKNIETSLRVLEEMEKEGLIIDTDEYGKIVVDLGRRLPPGATAAALHHGYDGYIIWQKNDNGFFITTPGQDIAEKFSQGRKIRGSMWLKPIDDPSPRTITLTEILNKLSGGNLKPTGKLKEYLDTEKTPVYNKDTVVEAKKSPESPKSQVVEKLLDDLDVSLANRANLPGANLEEYDLVLSELDEARDLNLSDPKKALEHLLLSDLELIDENTYNQKLKEINEEQGISTPPPSAAPAPAPADVEPEPLPSSEPTSPPPLPTSPSTANPEPQPTATPDSEEIKQAKLDLINNRIAEINTELSEKVLKWDRVRELKREREDWWKQKAKLSGREELEESEKWTDDQIDRFISYNDRPSNPLGIEKEYWKDLKNKKDHREAMQPGAENQQINSETASNPELERIKQQIREKEYALTQKHAYYNDQIAKMIEHAKATGRVPGVGPEGLAYWENEGKKIDKEVKKLERELKKLRKDLPEGTIIEPVQPPPLPPEARDLGPTLDPQIVPPPIPQQPEPDIEIPQPSAGPDLAADAKISPEPTNSQPEPLPITFEELQEMKKVQDAKDSLEAFESEENLTKSPTPDLERKWFAREFMDAVKSYYEKEQKEKTAPRENAPGPEKRKWNLLSLLNPFKRRKEKIARENEEFIKGVVEDIIALGNKHLTKEDLGVIKERLEKYYEEAGWTPPEEEMAVAVRNALEMLAKENNTYINREVERAIGHMRQEFVKVRGQEAADRILNPEKVKQIEDELKSRLNQLRSPQVVKDVENILELLKKNPPDPELLKRINEITNNLPRAREIEKDFMTKFNSLE
ncbi:MAG TPA: hypothetical protein VJJ72_02365 [Candidatus Paceibacterota bacterium]